jgi:hypothetical protein
MAECALRVRQRRRTNVNAKQAREEGTGHGPVRVSPLQRGSRAEGNPAGDRATHQAVPRFPSRRSNTPYAVSTPASTAARFVTSRRSWWSEPAGRHSATIRAAPPTQQVLTRGGSAKQAQRSSARSRARRRIFRPYVCVAPPRGKHFGWHARLGHGLGPRFQGMGTGIMKKKAIRRYPNRATTGKNKPISMTAA